MKKFVAMIMVAVMCCFMLTSCGDSKYVGTWKCDGLGMSIILEKDHTAKLAYEDEVSDDDDSVKWEVKDKKIILTNPDNEESDNLEFTIVDKETISLSKGGMSLEFKKQ